ncbi:patatin-like phospholipase family protein [Gluconobacter kondonii]|uniref:patatin-like phospholipase family protein n=1 Tax=Gluconobacter kondonii TaxID=941463 RepID=UPI001B8C275F|nr:patatin-like phospholipase family protein [Gluconobacter kondonii]
MGITRCYCIFEGGGAKGIAHVGALRALEQADFQIAGFAGTSAGSIVAALAAAGYTSEEMFGDQGSILDIIDSDKTNRWNIAPSHPVKTPIRLLGMPAWIVIRTLKRLSRRIWFFLFFLVLCASGVPYWIGIFNPDLEIALQAILLLSLTCMPFFFVYSIASLQSMSAAINQALSLKLRKNRDPAPVTFQDLKNAGCATLKIVATDITARSLRLFSADTTPNVSVGDAVAASACIPGIFRPYRVGDALFYDGGLVSNLPAWAFDAERAVDRDCWTAAIEIEGVFTEDKQKGRLERIKKYCASRLFGNAAPRGLDILSAALSSTVFGTGVLNTRNVDRLRSQPLEVDLGLLEFDITWKKAKDVIDAAHKASVADIVYQMRDLPNLIEDVCKALSSQAFGLINVARSSERKSRFDGRLRIALFFPAQGDPNSLVSEFNFGFESDSDERLRVPIQTSLVGQVWNGDDSLYLDDQEREEWDAYLMRPQDRWSRKFRWEAMSWILASPFFHAPSAKKIVIVLDSDKPLEVQALNPLLEALVKQIRNMVNLTLPMEAFSWLK